MSGVHTVPSRRGARKTLQTKTVLYTKAKHASPSEKEAPAGVLWELGGGEGVNPQWKRVKQKFEYC